MNFAEELDILEEGGAIEEARQAADGCKRDATQAFLWNHIQWRVLSLAFERVTKGQPAPLGMFRFSFGRSGRGVLYALTKGRLPVGFVFCVLGDKDDQRHFNRDLQDVNINGLTLTFLEVCVPGSAQSYKGIGNALVEARALFNQGFRVTSWVKNRPVVSDTKRSLICDT